MQKELREIVEKAVKSYGGDKHILTVVDIGANDGTLIKNYPTFFTRIAVEPIKKFAKEAKKHASMVINDFFNYKSFVKVAGKKKADIITAISCFYDIEKPNEFVEDVSKILDTNGVFIVQQNYVVTMLSENAFDNIVHEHLEYYSLHSMQNLLKRHNLEVFDVEESPINGGSFRTYIAYAGTRKVSKRVENMLSHEQKIGVDKKEIYLQFAQRVKENKRKLLSFLKKEVKKGKKIYIYGASTRGNTLLQYFGITAKLTPFAIERNEEKWGKYISSVGIPIVSEEEGRKQKPDYLLVLPWFFKEEFLQREKSYLASGGHFIFPLPEFEII
jgi:hypothetical protein